MHVALNARPVVSPARVAVMALATLALLEAWFSFAPWSPVRQELGHDYRLYMEAARRWLAGDGFYSAYQLAGPYQVLEREVLYPPFALVLFVPFTFLPPVLWWAIPLGIVAWIVAWHQPGPWALAGILACLTLPPLYSASWTANIVANGNPVMWAAAAVALATRWPAFGPLALLKPTPLLVPFALAGFRSRAWWAGLGLLIGVSLAFLPMWADYARALLNARGAGLLYALTSVPLMLVPVIAAGSGLLGFGRSQVPGERAAALDRHRVRHGEAVGAPRHGDVG
jgi:hypothetical protein